MPIQLSKLKLFSKRDVNGSSFEGFTYELEQYEHVHCISLIKQHFLAPLRYTLGISTFSALRGHCLSVDILVIADVRVIGLHLSLDHRLLPSAAGDHQTDEENLGVYKQLAN